MSTQERTPQNEEENNTAFISRDWVSNSKSIDASEFEELSREEQQHILWELSRDIPFKYANERHHGKMRRFLAGAVVSRCNVPTVLFETLPRIREFRQNRGRAECNYFGRESRIRVDFSSRYTSSAYGVPEGNVQHELLHATLRANNIDMPDRAFKRDGRTDRAWYFNGGLPNWDFDGEDAPPSTYLHRFDPDDNVAQLIEHTTTPTEDETSEVDESTPLVPEHVLEDALESRIEAYESNGLYEGEDDTHARDGRPDPFTTESTTPTEDTDIGAFLLLVGEANIAWYTTAKSFSDGYEEVSRKSIFWDEYSATNPDEFLCRVHEFLQKPGSYDGTYATIEQLVERHPWLLKRYLDCFTPHPDKKQALDWLLDECHLSHLNDRASP